MLPEMERSDLREKLCKSYRIVYQIDEDREALNVVRIWHMSRRSLPPDSANW
jgi:mRNA-degrading endonuclease RelE of RelBE toxin-antitoxin system